MLIEFKSVVDLLHLLSTLLNLCLDVFILFLSSCKSDDCEILLDDGVVFILLKLWIVFLIWVHIGVWFFTDIWFIFFLGSFNWQLLLRSLHFDDFNWRLFLSKFLLLNTWQFLSPVFNLSPNWTRTLAIKFHFVLKAFCFTQFSVFKVFFLACNVEVQTVIVVDSVK